MLKKLQDEMRQNSLEKIKENNKRIDELELQLINATNEKDELKKRLADEKEKLLAQNAINKLKIEEENRALGVVSALYIARPQFLFVTYLIISRYTKIHT